MITPEELATRFTYHPPRTGQPETYIARPDVLIVPREVGS